MDNSANALPKDLEPLFSADAPLVTAEQLNTWIVFQDERVVVFNKPGWVVCHPSKNGPFSSLVGAAREVLGLNKVHLVSRLDRETSGLVILAKTPRWARELQMALADRRVIKVYRAILEGNMTERTEVSQPVGPDRDSPVMAKQCVVGRGMTGQKAQTTFKPLDHAGNFTLVEVIPHTGRKHQIRAHAQWLGHPVAGDKIYGPDPNLFLEFIESGWTARLSACLPLPRQALHAHQMTFMLDSGDLRFNASWPSDLADFWNAKKGEKVSEAPSQQ